MAGRRQQVHELGFCVLAGTVFLNTRCSPHKTSLVFPWGRSVPLVVRSFP